MNAVFHLPPAAPVVCRRRPLPACLLACFVIAAAGHVVLAQDDDGFTSWTKVEGAAETRDFKEKVRAGTGIDQKSRAFLEEIALPQLALEGNRATIATLRKRLREFLLNDIPDDKSGDEANRIFMAFMQTLASKDDEATVVRVNAMLLIGELQTSGSAGRKPWPGATTTLVKAVAGTDQPTGVRIAAAVGLARHLDAARANPDALAKIAKEVVSPVVSVVKEMAAAGDGPENDWLASRCLSMLALLGPATPETAAEIMKLLESPQRSFDTRVRAALALAAVAGPQSKVDAAAAILAIEKLSVASLQSDADAAERSKLEKLFAGGGGIGGPGMSAPGMSAPGMMPGYTPPEAMGPPAGFGSPSDPSGSGGFGQFPAAEQSIPREVCRRAAWRLAALANAILTADGKAGLGLQAGDAAAAAKKLAENMRGAAMTLDANPVDASLLQALADLKPAPPAADESEAPTGDDADKPNDADKAGPAAATPAGKKAGEEPAAAAAPAAQ